MKVAIPLSLLITGLLATAGPSSDGSAKIKRLHAERIATLKQLVDTMAVLVKNSEVSQIDLLKTRRLVLDATLDASETTQERVAVLKDIVELAKQIESIVESGAKRGEVSYEEPFKAKAARIKAEIDLEKATADVPLSK